MNNGRPDFHFTYHRSQRESFRKGILIEHWRERYPNIFDADDIRVLRTEFQRQYHFFEWLSAVLLFEATGYLSLVEGYTANSHADKRLLFSKIVGQEVFDWAVKYQSGQPDLFVYRDVSDWFFCEVKGGPDRLRNNQRQWMNEFNNRMGRQVKIIQLDEFKNGVS